VDFLLSSVRWGVENPNFLTALTYLEMVKTIDFCIETETRYKFSETNRKKIETHDLVESSVFHMNYTYIMLKLRCTFLLLLPNLLVISLHLPMHLKIYKAETYDKCSGPTKCWSFAIASVFGLYAVPHHANTESGHSFSTIKMTT